MGSSILHPTIHTKSVDPCRRLMSFRRRTHKSDPLSSSPRHQIRCQRPSEYENHPYKLDSIRANLAAKASRLMVSGFIQASWIFLGLLLFTCWSSNLAAAGPQDEPEQLCVVAGEDIAEASGMAISRENPDHIWIHNDSGDSARLFLVNRRGETIAVVSLADVQPRDWEDMCSFSVDGENWLLIADTGDNGRARTASTNPCTLLLFKEPKIDLPSTTKKSKVQKLNTRPTTTLQMSYPDGPADCESVAVDSARREIFVVSKADPLSCKLFRTKLSLEPGRQQVALEEVSSPGVPFATAMDISPDGNQLLICSMFMGAVLRRDNNGGWQNASIETLRLPARRQGETACFDVDPSFALFGSEGIRQPIWRMRLTTAAGK